MDRFEDMKTFLRVVEAGSFTGAADQLNTAKSAVSRRISELERYLGVRLLQRTTRKLSLTETGQYYYERVQRLLDDLEDMEYATRGKDAAMRGALRVAAPLSFGQRHLVPALDAFLEQNPLLDLDLHLDDRKIDLVEAGMDMGLRIGDPTQGSLIARRLTVVRRSAAASPAYLEKYGEPKTPEEFEASHKGLLYTYTSASAHWSFLGPDGEVHTVRPSIRMRSNNGDFLLQAALAGKGIIALPTFISFQALRDGLLKPILQDYSFPELAAYAVFAPGRQLSHKVRIFIDYLVGYFGKSLNAPHWDD